MKGWFVLFPNMEVKVNGEWKKGVAVRLQLGTVITWDAQLIRHCTSLPRLEVNDKGEFVSMTHGTYFGIDGRVARQLKRDQEQNKMVNKKRKRT